jgi:hypothetical protein
MQSPMNLNATRLWLLEICGDRFAQHRLKQGEDGVRSDAEDC